MMLTDEIMPNYRRARVAGATYFFTVNLWDRSSDLLVRHVDLLREAMRMTRSRHPFQIDAWVKYHFSRRLPQAEPRTLTCRLRHERGVWQRRYWEHLIRDEEDYRRHVDYIHINPLKHGHVGRVADWPYSTFHRAVREGLYPQDWAGEPDGGQRAALTTLPGFARTSGRMPD